MITYYVVRHGKKEQGVFDPPLTNVGISQAEKTADALKHIQFSNIFASPKLRTQQTADIIAKHHSIPVVTDMRLLERMEWEQTQTFEEFMAEWNKTQLDKSYIPQQGTSSRTNGEQMKYFLKEISEKQKEGNILIVTHGGTIGDLLRTLFTEQGIKHKQEPEFGASYIDISECSITIIANTNDIYTYSSIGDTSHLLPK